MKNKLKLLLPATLLAVGLAFTACGGGGDEPDTPDVPVAEATPTPAPPAEADDPTEDVVEEVDVPSRDLGGAELIIANWWGNYDTDYFEPATLQQELTLDWRIYIENRYNFRMREVAVTDWGGMQELTATSILAGDPVGHIIMLEPMWFAALHGQGLFAPLDVPSVNFDYTPGVPWNLNTIAATMTNGRPYGFSIGALSGAGVYFNQRLFEEAGLDPELPFNLQAAGEWTWEAFMDIARQLTRDVDNDGVIDTWAIATFSNDILLHALASNNAAYIGRDAAGNFYNRTTEPAFLETLTFVNNLHVEGLMMPQPEGSEWNWFNEAFWNAEVAMRTGGHYMAGAHINEQLNDPWGFVHFPVGPNSNQPGFLLNANITVVPATFDADFVDDIMYVYTLWMTTPEEFRDPLAWMSADFVNHSNPRSVEETIYNFTRNPLLQSPSYNGFIPGLQVGDIAWSMWQDDSDPSAIVEAAQPAWNVLIAQANGEDVQLEEDGNEDEGTE